LSSTNGGLSSFKDLRKSQRSLGDALFDLFGFWKDVGGIGGALEGGMLMVYLEVELYSSSGRKVASTSSKLS
jgi:hypothetical protein